MSYMKHKLTMQMGVRNVNMYSYCIMHKLLNSTVDGNLHTPALKMIQIKNKTGSQ